jgi:hypothetical protein
MIPPAHVQDWIAVSEVVVDVKPQVEAAVDHLSANK